MEKLLLVLSMPKIVLIGYQFRKCLLDAVQKINDDLNNILIFKFYSPYNVDSGLVDEQEFIDEISSADVVLVDVRGGDRVSKLVVSTLKDTKNTVIVLVGGSPEIIRLTRMGSFSLDRFMRLRDKPILRRIFGKKGDTLDYGKIVKMRGRFEKLGSCLRFGVFRHARNYALILRYYEYPCFENYYNMFLLLLKEYCGVKIKQKIYEPKTIPPMGVQDFHTDKIYVNVEDYLHDYSFSDRPLVGILFYGGYHYDQSLPAAKLLAQKLESLGVGVIPVFCSDLRYYMAIEKFFFVNEKPIIEVLIDLLWFRFAGGPIGGDHTKTKKVLRRLNVPILHGIHLSSLTVDEWKKSQRGVPPIETVTSVILPELDGRNEPIVTHAPLRKNIGGVEVSEYVAIEERVSRLASRAINWIKLRRKENFKKRIAIIVYNYPPGEENLGKAAYLDVFASLLNLLRRMKEHGYSIPSIPNSPKELKDLFIRHGLVNSGEWILTPSAIQNLPKIPADVYRKWFEELPPEVKEGITKIWGDAPGTIMVFDGKIIIPGVILGNIFIGIQPSRGIHEDPSKIYHDRNVPPHHQYVAFYLWLRKKFCADAVVHLGTHGTLEFLPGKEVGLSGKCFPDILIGDLPNIYVYHAVNSSESSIAKRRSYAVIINHASPAITISDLPEDLAELSRLIDQYFDTLQYDKSKARDLEKEIIARAQKFGLGSNIDEIHDRLEEYRRSLIPKGLHILGREFSKDEILEYLTYVARYDRSKAKSLHRLIAEQMGIDYDEIILNPHGITNGTLNSKIFNDIEREVRDLIVHCVIGNGKLESFLKVKSKDFYNSIDFLRSVYHRIIMSDELGAVIRALNGEFIEPGPGGDFIRNPQIFPTGRNTYQLDPTNIPTEIAMKRGEFIAEEFLRNYYEKYGRYPRVVSVVLWAFETMKTGGETIATIFRLLGVRPVWKSIYIRDLEVIPLEELGRPRIDVVVTICGIFRDTFYNIIELLDRAFKLVASLHEPLDANYVRANVVESKEKFGDRALLRIFGPPEGKYATSLTTIIEKSEWSTESDLVNAYLESMKFAYGEDKRSVDVRSFFEHILSKVDIVAQVRDNVEYEITDLDHYYEFLGGLSRSVAEARGEKPVVFVADSTREIVKVERAEDAIRRGIMTRILNPKWIDSMLKHGYCGITKIADRVEYMLGLAATIGGIEDWMWEKVAEKLVFDESRAKTMREDNPWAYQKLIGRLLEAAKRGYWAAKKETIERLEREYLSVEELLEGG